MSGIAHFSGAFPNWRFNQDATNWVLELMQIYPTSGITPAFFTTEAESEQKMAANFDFAKPRVSSRR